MIKRIKMVGLIGLCAAFFASMAIGDISRVRVANNSSKTIYIHVGGYAPSSSIAPGRWKIFYYPFTVVPPGSSGKVSTSLLVASSGGRWVTTPNGFTSLNKPTMVICLDYKSADHRHKTGNRVWTIKGAQGFDKNCQVKGYRQPWYRSE